jgi:hypothetical protein
LLGLLFWRDRAGFFVLFCPQSLNDPGHRTVKPFECIVGSSVILPVEKIPTELASLTLYRPQTT